VTLRESNDPAAAQCALTVDVEDWYQSSVDYDAPISGRVVRNTDRLLLLLDEHQVRGTFFVQGLVAEAFPSLVRRVVAEGHDVQSHGFSHRPLFAMSPDQLRAELRRARSAIEDACGRRLTMFRAPDFSIVRENLWALEVIAEAGFEIDSSVFPMAMRRYGISDWDPAPKVLTLSDGLRLTEVPVSVVSAGRWRLPVAGGGYFRLLPRPALEYALRRILAEGRPAVVYCHPYDFNADELADYRRVVPRRFRLSQGLGRSRLVSRLRGLFDRLTFGRLDEVLDAWVHGDAAPSLTT
jgi:polysaccharide deacetylase family protein (PEP-CTERM system associated)